MMTDSFNQIPGYRMARSYQTAAVVVSTYNRPRALDLVLKGLADQEIAPNQIVIGDDGSGPQTQQIIDLWKERGLPIERCWHPDEGYRKTIIMNRAFSKVRQPLTIFLDGDCIPSRRFVSDHLTLSEPGFILAGPRILANSRYTQDLESGIAANWENLTAIDVLRLRMNGSINRIGPLVRLPDGPWRRAKPKKWQLVRGCNFSVATRDVWNCDGFEESLYGWGPDDSDIAVRLINGGLKVKTGRFACPVLHLWHKEESRQGLEKNRRYLQSAIDERRTRAVTGLSSHGLACPI
jgi:glycosyltransferase involved in cell wall biosynthesis